MISGFPTHSSDRLRVISWNLLRRVGAGVEDVAKLVKSHHPDLLLLQECTEDIISLPSLVGGHFFRHPMQSRIYGLAAWSPHPFPPSTAIRLPYSILPGRVPPRLAQIISFRRHHHRQCASQPWPVPQPLPAAPHHGADGWARRHHRRFQCRGSGRLPGLFSDIGPRKRTHRAGNIVALRLDRCIARGLVCSASEVLDKGPSDHHPMVLDMKVDAVFLRAPLEDSSAFRSLNWTARRPSFPD